MNHNIHQYVQGCVVYQRTKSHRHCMYDAVMPLLISMRQFNEISIDFMMNLSSSTLDDYIYNIVLVIVN